MNRRNAAYVLPALLLVMLLGAARAGSADSGPAADGRGFFTFQGETFFFSFQAKERPKGDKGRARLTNLSAGTFVDIRIDCLNSDGSSANLRGAVTRSDDPAVPEGEVVFFAVTDWDALGSDRPDDITPLFPASPGLACEDTPFPLTILPVTEGDIRVRP